MIAGLDYSMTSPAICLSDFDFNYEDCIFSYLTTSKKYDVQFNNIKGKFLDYSYNIQRYDLIAIHFLDMMLDYGVKKCYIEGYSMGSKGRVFDIAENTGIFKHSAWRFGIDVITVAPTAIKKFATGKGNANKEKMQDVFINETGVNLKEQLNMTEKQWNPSSDIIDAYYVCKYAIYEETKNA
jgi:Holliday junction resolvasome RuvABC endonuclease subunit